MAHPVSTVGAYLGFRNMAHQGVRPHPPKWETPLTPLSIYNSSVLAIYP